MEIEMQDLEMNEYVVRDELKSIDQEVNWDGAEAWIYN